MTNRQFFLTALLALLGATAIFAQGTSFTYQGRLNDGTGPATGNYDLTFALFNASSNGSQLGGTITNTATAVTNGLFIVTLDLGANFPGADRWLELGVRPTGSTNFTLLAPRQKITAASAASLSGTLPAAQITGNLPATQLSGMFELNPQWTTATLASLLNKGVIETSPAGLYRITPPKNAAFEISHPGAISFSA